MEGDAIVKLIGGGSAVAALVYVFYLIGTRMVAAIDKLAAGVLASNTAAETRHTELVGVFSDLRGRIRERALTPVEPFEAMNPGDYYPPTGPTPQVQNTPRNIFVSDIVDVSAQCPIVACRGYFGHAGPHGANASPPRRRSR